MANRVHKISSIVGGMLFVADNLYIHTAWHLATAIGVSTCNMLLEQCFRSNAKEIDFIKGLILAHKLVSYVPHSGHTKDNDYGLAVLLVEGPNRGSIGKLSVKFHSKGDAKPDEEDMKKGKAKGEALFKAIEGYFLANPAQY
ncbi:ABA-responsive protein [Arachis hypogaea]|nr:ABA-responsive protein [Arachis hypogaea]